MPEQRHQEIATKRELRTPFLIVGETWFPQNSKAKPRKIVWVGVDQRYGEAVRWSHPGEIETSIMQEKAFRWWITKHGAKL